MTWIPGSTMVPGSLDRAEGRGSMTSTIELTRAGKPVPGSTMVPGSLDQAERLRLDDLDHRAHPGR